MSDPGSSPSARKASLVLRAELDRLRVSANCSSLAASLRPTPSPERAGRLRPKARIVMGVLLPLLGATRAQRWLRWSTIALTAARVARGFRAR